MNNHIQPKEEIDIKRLIKKSIEISKNNKKTFLWLFVITMLISTLFFINEIISPEYKSENILKSRYVKKDQLQNIIDSYNASIQNNNSNLPNSVLKEVFIKNKIKKFEITEIKPDLNSPDKNDGIKLYKLNIVYKTKPKEMGDLIEIVKDIQEISSNDNEIISTKEITNKSISEIDTLLKVASDAGNAFKNKINLPGNMMVMNDLYKSLNEILERKADLKSKQASLQTNNIIYISSTWVLTKSVKVPILYFFIGFAIWILFSLLWIAILSIKNDN